MTQAKALSRLQLTKKLNILQHELEGSRKVFSDFFNAFENFKLYNMAVYDVIVDQLCELTGTSKEELMKKVQEVHKIHIEKYQAQMQEMLKERLGLKNQNENTDSSGQTEESQDAETEVKNKEISEDASPISE